MRRAALAVGLLASGLAASGAEAEPALEFSGDGWRLPIEPEDVSAFQVLTPPGRGVAVVVSLHAGPGAALAQRTGDGLGETVTLRDHEGTVLLETVLTEPIRRGLFAVTLADPEGARRLSRRLSGGQ